MTFNITSLLVFYTLAFYIRNSYLNFNSVTLLFLQETKMNAWEDKNVQNTKQVSPTIPCFGIFIRIPHVAIALGNLPARG
jgi:hypothetical protein